MHEQAYRPEGLEFDYMVGNLREELNNNAFRKLLTIEGENRARAIGISLRTMMPDVIVTEDFATPRETARIISEVAGVGKPISLVFDKRICEGKLSYMSKKHFKELVKIENEGDPNATIRDWISNSPEDFDNLVKMHIDTWNEQIKSYSGERIVFVLHVEGVLLYPTLLLSLKPKMMCCLQIPRSLPINIKLFPDKDPVIRFGITNYCSSLSKSIFSQY